MTSKRYRNALGLLCALAVLHSGLVFAQDSDAASHVELRRQAKALHQSHNTTAAIALITARMAVRIDDARLSPTIAENKLMLGHLYVASNDKKRAAETFRAVAGLLEGVNDAARGEAALRMAYLTPGRERGVWAERIIAGEYQVSMEAMEAAHRMAGAEAQRRGDLHRAVEVYESSPALAGPADSSKRSHVLKELAGLYFELAKGEGKSPLAVAARPVMWERARAACQELINGPANLPEGHRMVAELMNMETYWFQGDYQKVRNLGNNFFARWGANTAARAHSNERQFINTALTLKMQNDFILGRLEDAENVAKTFIERRPPSNEEFPNSDSFLIGLLVMKLCANERGEQVAVAEYGLRAADHRADYIGTQMHLLRQRQIYTGVMQGPDL